MCGDDFTIRGGAYSPASLKKGLYAEELAIDRKVPLVRLLEAGGASDRRRDRHARALGLRLDGAAGR